MPSDAHDLPAQFLARLQRLIPSSRWSRTLRTFTTPRPTTFRVNTLAAPVREIREALVAQGFRLEPVAWYPEAFVLREGRLRDLQATDLYREGTIYVQSLSSMLPPLVLDPQPGETVLDLTAAPGSKTTQMACLMRGEGRIIANDNNRVRGYKLQANIALQRARNVEVTCRFGEAFGYRHPAQFDRVLLDAPCSAEGRFQAQEPASHRYWSLRKIHEMARKQRRLLAAALTALRPGGVLVYSTCTFAPEENEAILHDALERSAGLVGVEAVTLGLANWMPGLAIWEGRPFHPGVRRAVRILPTDDIEGFFIARLRKREEAK